MCTCFACDKSAVIMLTKVKYFDKCVIISLVLPFLLSVSELGSRSNTLSVLAVKQKSKRKKRCTPLGVKSKR